MAGGGTALVRSRAAVEKLAKSLDGDEATGARIVAQGARRAAQVDRHQRRPRGCGDGPPGRERDRDRRPQRRHRERSRTWSRPASSTRPRSPARRCRTRRRWPACSSPPRRSWPTSPRRPTAAPPPLPWVAWAADGRHGRHGDDVATDLPAIAPRRCGRQVTRRPGPEPGRRRRSAVRRPNRPVRADRHPVTA